MVVAARVGSGTRSGFGGWAEGGRALLSQQRVCFSLRSHPDHPADEPRVLPHFTVVLPNQILLSAYICGARSGVEYYVPYSHTGIRTSAHELAILSIFLQPEHSIDSSQTSILDCDLRHWPLHAPNIHIGIKGSGGTVSAVGSPLDRVNSCRVGSPSRGNQLSRVKRGQRGVV